MEFFLKKDELSGASIRRIIDEQIVYALDLLKNPDVERDIAVHESRKALKKVRALLRLIRDEIGTDIYQRENVYYRDIGRSLAPLRDSFVLVEVLDKVKATTQDKPIRQVCVPIRRALMKQYRQTRKTMLADDTIPQAIDALESGRNRLSDLAFSEDDFSVLRDGLKRSYRRGKKRMKVAYNVQNMHILAAENVSEIDIAPPSKTWRGVILARNAESRNVRWGKELKRLSASPIPVTLPELFHEWRKRVKDLWYQTDVLSPIWPAIVPVLAEQMHKLSEILGDAHDLAVLHETIAALPDFDYEASAPLLTLISSQQSELEHLAYALGLLVYRESPTAFVERIAGYWHIWQQTTTSLTLYMPDTQPI